MKNEDVAIIEGNLKEVKIKISAIKEIDKFIKELHETKSLTIYAKSSLCLYQTYDVIGKELSEMLEKKKIQLKEEIHSFTLDQLLPEEKEIKNSELGFKFTINDDYCDVDDKTYYFKTNENETSANCSWFTEGKLTTVEYVGSKFELCQEKFENGTWIKL